MYAQAEDVQAAGAGAGEDLEPDFTLEELLAELDQDVTHELRRPGDIDVEMMLARYGARDASWANRKMRDLAKHQPEKWMHLRVYDQEKKRSLCVLRKCR